MTVSFHGIGITPRIAIGPVHILYRDLPEINEYVIPEKYIDSEVKRYQAALQHASNELTGIRNSIPTSTPTEITSFIDTHVLMLNDPMFSDVPIELIKVANCNAEWALKQQHMNIVNVFNEMDDPYLRTRRDDVDHVVNAIMKALLSGAEYHGPMPPQEQRLAGSVLVSADISPSEIVLYYHQGISAIVTEAGGPTSHTAILAKSLNIPAIVGLHNIQDYLTEGETVAIDGRFGLVLTDLDDDSLTFYHALKREQGIAVDELQQLRDETAVTLDGTKIKLLANTELPEELELLDDIAIDGIGLYRTEFLYMNRAQLPDEEEQFNAYRQVIDYLEGRPLTLRTLDIGADKTLQIPEYAHNKSINPALGLRAIRLCLNEPGLFMPQLRAVLRASAFGPVKIMLPMLSTTHEIQQTLNLIERTKKELAAEKIKFDKKIQIGAMIEVPAAAISAMMFTRHLDFLSIGTNDLIQYALAIDRVDDEVNYLYDPVHPAVIQLIATTLQAGKKANIPVSMCGEMAAEPRFTRLLLGLGLKEFSMHPNSILEVKQIVRNSNLQELEQQCRALLDATDIEQYLDILDKIMFGNIEQVIPD